MIDLYTWITPNGLKISILLEELGLPYRAHAVDITRGDQDTPSFRAVSPSGKIPAIVVDGGSTLMESGAIMIHLAEGYRDRLLERLRPPRQLNLPGFDSPAYAQPHAVDIL